MSNVRRHKCQYIDAKNIHYFFGLEDFFSPSHNLDRYSLFHAYFSFSPLPFNRAFTFLQKWDILGLFLVCFRCLQTTTIGSSFTTNKCKQLSIYVVIGAGIRSRNLLNMSLIPLPLDRGSCSYFPYVATNMTPCQFVFRWLSKRPHHAIAEMNFL